MIESFATQGTEDIFNGDDTKAARKTLPKDLWGKAVARLDQLNAAAKVGDMAIPPSNRLETLKGDRTGQWSVRVNDLYRVCFKFGSGDADDVEIVDCHWRNEDGEQHMIPKNRVPTHPGQLLGRTLEKMHMTQGELAKRIGMSLQTVNTLVNGKRSMTASVAIALAKVFDTSAELWMNLQVQRDLWLAQHQADSNRMA